MDENKRFESIGPNLKFTHNLKIQWESFVSSPLDRERVIKK